MNGRRLLRSLWVARLVTFAGGLVVIGALLGLQWGHAARGARTPESLALPQRAARTEPRLDAFGHLDDDDDDQEGIPDGQLDEDDDDDGGDQQVAFSLSNIGRLLGWGAPDADEVAAADDGDPDSIRIKDMRPLDELGHEESPADWADSALLKAFLARFGAPWSTTVRTTETQDQDLDGGEMADFVAETTSSTSGVNVTDAPLLPGLPLCPMNGIITSQEGAGTGPKIFEYIAAWLVSRGVGVGWRTPVVPAGVLRELSPLFAHLSLPAVEQLPPACRPEPRALEAPDGGVLREIDLADIGNLQSLPARFADPKIPLVVHRNAILLALLPTHLGELRKELALREDLRLASRTVFRECRQQLARDYDGQDHDDDDKVDDDATIFVGLLVRRRGPQRRAAVGVDFFRLAMAYFRTLASRQNARVVFVVASDDVEWMNANLAAADVCAASSLTRTSRTPDLPDVALLASCDHAITDLSADSLAAALLVPGEVIYPKVVKSGKDVQRIKQLESLPGWTFVS